MIGRTWRRVVHWATPTLVLIEVVLVWSGWISLGAAIGTAVIIEILLYLTAASRAIAGARAFRGSRAAGQDGWHALEDGLAELVARTLARIVLIEPRMLACLLSWPTHRTSPPDRAFRYDANLRALIWVVIALVIAEGAVVDLVLAVAVPGSIWVWVALGLHVYGAVWLLGFLASVATRPHLLDDQALRLRDGIFTEMSIPYDAVLSAEVASHPNFGRSGLKTVPTEHSALLAYGDANVRLTLDPTIPVHIEGRGPMPLRILRVTADAPAALVAALRQRAPSATNQACRNLEGPVVS